MLGRRWHIPREEEEEEDKEEEEEKEEKEEEEGNRKRRRAGKKKKSNNPTMQGRTQTKLYIYNWYINEWSPGQGFELGNVGKSRLFEQTDRAISSGLTEPSEFDATSDMFRAPQRSRAG